jgi:phosphoglycolate phosphatase-like HAD superfamily hydrolase
MENKTHLSFDLDGTLIDSLPLMKKSWENAIQKLNINVSWEEYKKNIGLPFDDICKNLKLSDISSELKELYFNFNKNNIELIKPMRGLEECIAWIEENKIEWSIITSKPSITAIDICENFSLLPNYLITSDMLSMGKPSNAPSNHLKNLLKNKPRKFYYVGDTLIDFIFALNSSFSFIEFVNLDAEIYCNVTDTKLIMNHRIIISDLAMLKLNISN